VPKKSSHFESVGNGFAFLHRFFDISIFIGVLVGICQLYGVPFDKNYLILLLFHIVGTSYIAEALQLYRSWRINQFRNMLWLVCLLLGICFAGLISMLFLFKVSETFSRVVVVGWYLGSAFLMLSWRLIFRIIRKVQVQNGVNLQRMAIVGLTPRGIELYEEIKAQPELGFECIGFFDDREADRFPPEYRNLLNGSISDAVMTAQSGVISRLYITLPLQAERRIQQIVQQLGDTTLNVYLVPDFLLMSMMQGRLSAIGDIDTISVFESPHYGAQNYFKRTFDIVFSLVALLFLMPLMFIIAISIKLTSVGPALFVQERYGLDGKKIGVYKFRSMKVMENSATVVQASRNDSRVTGVGRFLRRTSLDELPQFINVLLGQMSVVGPRPHAVAHNEFYRSQVSFYMLRHTVKPGITGWAQINGWRGETDTLEKMEKRIEYDLYYIRNWSLWFDIKIIVKTVFKGFSGQHVY